MAEIKTVLDGFSIQCVAGHGFVISPPSGNKWVAFENTPAAEFVAAVLSANAGKADEMVLVSKALPECKHECTSSGTEISDTVLIIGEAEDGSSGVGIGHFQDDGKWIHYGGDYDFMIVTKVIAWKQIPSQLAIHRALQADSTQQAIDAGKV